MPGWPLPPGEPSLYPPVTPGGFTAPTLDDWQFQYRDAVFGANSGIGVLKVRGLGGLPTVGSQDAPFPRDTGEYIGLDVMDGRDPEFDLWINENVSTALAVLGSVFGVIADQPQPLWFQIPGFPVLCSMCRPRKRLEEWDAEFAAVAVWAPTVSFHANDPRLYAQGQTASNPGAEFPVDSITVDNAGNCECRPVLIINGGDGGKTGPNIANLSIGNDAVIVFDPTFNVAPGDTVVVDMATPHTVTYWPGGLGSAGAQYSVYNAIEQQATKWWTLNPGTNNISVGVASGDHIGADGFEVWWANAYML